MPRPPTENPTQRAGRREWIGLSVLTLACLLYVMDLTVLHLAVPAISEDLQPSSAQLLWIIDIYGFMVAGFLITMGTLGDRIGRRKLLLIGAAAFGVAVAPRGVLDEPRDAHRQPRPPRDRRRHARAVDPVADLHHVPGPAPALGRHRGLDLGVLGRQRHRPGPRRDPARALLVGLGVPARRAGDGRCCSSSARSSCPSTGIPTPAGSTCSAPRMSLVAVLAVIFGLKQIAQDGFGLVPVASIVVGLVVGVAVRPPAADAGRSR